MFSKLHRAAIAVALAGITVLSAPSPASAGTTTDLPNFRVGIQANDKGKQVGDIQVTPYASFGGGCSPWAGDRNTYDPDGVSIALQGAPKGLLGNKDFRIGVQATDKAGTQTGTLQWTPWVSQGGGTSGWALDSDRYDPDQFRVCLEVRPMPEGVSYYDFRLLVRVVDHGDADQGGYMKFTPWAGEGGGSSPFAVDPNSYDPDGVAVGIDVY